MLRQIISIQPGLLCKTFFLACLSVTCAQSSELVFKDDFMGLLGDGWAFEREERANWRVGPNGLEVRVQPGNMWGGANNAKNVFVHPIPAPTDAPIEISVAFSNSPTAQWEQANLVWYYDGGNMVKLGQELVTKRLSIVMGREENDRARTVAIIPLDANAVELRLQAVNNQLRGQFRTAPWNSWRDVGECDLPVKGEPKASLHFYNGPAQEEHWVKVNNFAVRRLPATSVDWPRIRVEEKISRASDSPRVGTRDANLPGGFGLLLDVNNAAADPKAQYEQRVFAHKDGSFGWSWERRASDSTKPTFAGVVLGGGGSSPSGRQSQFQPLKIAEIKTLEVELDAVTRLENDHGDHTLALVLQCDELRKVTVWFDWYDGPYGVQTLNDGYRDYGYVQRPSPPTDFQYRIRGFRGAPPRVNLQPFLADASKRGLPAGSSVRGIWFGNEIWNGSRGGTLVTKFDVLVNGQRYSSVPIQPGRP